MEKLNRLCFDSLKFDLLLSVKIGSGEVEFAPFNRLNAFPFDKSTTIIAPGPLEEESVI